MKLETDPRRAPCSICDLSSLRLEQHVAALCSIQSSNKRSDRERLGPTVGVRFTVVFVKRESTVQHI